MKKSIRIISMLMAMIFLIASLSILVSADNTTLYADSTSITVDGINSGSQYGINLIENEPRDSWATPSSGDTFYTFSNLNPGTKYYVYEKSATGVKLIGEISTVPQVIKQFSSSSTIRVGTTGFVKIQISKTNSPDEKKWISTKSNGSGYFSFSETEMCNYTIQANNSQAVFSDLTKGTVYYIFGQTEDGRNSSALIWAPAPDISDITTNNGELTVPYNHVSKYSINNSAFIKPTSTAQTVKTSSGETITVTYKSGVVVFSGLSKKTSYSVVAQVYNNDVAVSDTSIPATITTPDTVPTKPILLRQTEDSLYIKYDSNLVYRIDGSAWTKSSFSIYPEKDSPVSLGRYSYFFMSPTNPSVMIFTGLQAGTAYTIEVKYANDPSVSNIVTVVFETKECPHVWGEKSYLEDGLHYTHVCSLCGKQELGLDTVCAHVKVRDEVVPSTCSTAGYTVRICNVCGTEVSERNYLPLLEHTYSNSCDDTCNLCGATRVVTHMFEKVRTEPTCTAMGFIKEVCSQCGAESGYFEEIPKLEHKWSDWVITKTPSALEDGEKVIWCNDCHFVKESQIIPRYQVVVSEEGTTYWLISNESSIELSNIAAIADGKGSITVKFDGSNGIIQLDQLWTMAFIQEKSSLHFAKLTDYTQATGNFDNVNLEDESLAIYEIDAKNVMKVE
ncbi:MAG: hypothetical protein MJ236_04150, partial [Clostridia bacterium]|nr:hypothetical protein [Clostridia bacterium]